MLTQPCVVRGIRTRAYPASLCKISTGPPDASPAHLKQLVAITTTSRVLPAFYTAARRSSLAIVGRGLSVQNTAPLGAGRGGRHGRFASRRLPHFHKIEAFPCLHPPSQARGCEGYANRQMCSHTRSNHLGQNVRAKARASRFQGRTRFTFGSSASASKTTTTTTGPVLGSRLPHPYAYVLPPPPPCALPVRTRYAPGGAGVKGAHAGHGGAMRPHNHAATHAQSAVAGGCARECAARVCVCVELRGGRWGGGGAAGLSS